MHRWCGLRFFLYSSQSFRQKASHLGQVLRILLHSRIQQALVETRSLFVLTSPVQHATDADAKPRVRKLRVEHQEGLQCIIVALLFRELFGFLKLFSASRNRGTGNRLGRLICVCRC